MRTQKEIENKIKELYKLLKENKMEVLRCIITTDALSWVLGEDYLDNLGVYDEETND